MDDVKIQIGDVVLDRWGVAGQVDAEYANFWAISDVEGNFRSMAPQSWLDAQSKPFTHDEINKQRWFSVRAFPGGSGWCCEGGLKFLERPSGGHVSDQSGNMTPEETVRRNTSIALYMGWEKSKAGAWFNESEMKTGESSPPPFHEKYGLLMPVVERIMLETAGNFILISCFGGEFAARMDATKGGGPRPTLIEAVFIAVSDWVIAREAPTP